MRIIIVGPGSAGMALALKASQVGHDLVAIVGRALPEIEANRVGATPVHLGDQLPDADLVLIAVRDDAIETVAAALAPQGPSAVVHVSGLKSIDALAALEGSRTGSFHPLQTLPDPDIGALRLAGAAVAITTPDSILHDSLVALAESMGMQPFDLPDDAKATYHAAAAAAANFPLAALAMASDLFAAVDLPFSVARPLTEAVIANAFELGPRAALTGPVARGDVETVRAQLEAVRKDEPAWEDGFLGFVRLLADLAGRQEFDGVGQ